MNTASRIHIAASPRPDRRPADRFEPLHSFEVVAEEHGDQARGRAILAGWLLAGGTPLATYRLTIAGRDLAGLYTCDGQRFVPVTA